MKIQLKFILLFFPLFVFGQARHDLKVDLVQGLLRSANFSYEASPTKHFGLELGFGHTWGEIGIFAGQAPSVEEYLKFDQTVGQVSLMGKYYPSPKANSDGWFYGGYFVQKFELSRDPGYSLAYEEKYGKPPAEDRNLWSGLGGTGGYKKVFNNRLIVEFGFSADMNMASLLASKDKRTLDFGGTIQAKIGYRIAAPKEEGGLDQTTGHFDNGSWTCTLKN